MPRQENEPRERSGFAFVIGGGGAAGSASSCGALRALAEVTGIEVDQATVVIGTSAGAAIGTELRLGRSIEGIVEGLQSDDPAGMGASMKAAWKTRPELLRRVAGSTYVMAQTAFPGAWRTARPWPLVQRAFPGSLVSIPQAVWNARFPTEWPQRALWLVASDLDSGQRVVLTGERFAGADVPLVRAVQASCAVPGVFPPVRIGKRRLVDGGVQSPTNLDVAATTGCRAVIALAPMSFDRTDPPGFVRSAGRMRSNTRLDREAAKVRRAGMEVLAIRPGADELRHHRFNILSRRGHEDIMEAAYETTLRRLRAGEGADLLAQMRSEALERDATAPS